MTGGPQDLQPERRSPQLQARVSDLEFERDFFATVATVTSTYLIAIGRDAVIHAPGANAAFLEAVGLQGEDVVGARLGELVGATEELEAGVEEARAGRSVSVERESTWRANDGRRLTVMWTCTPLPNRNDEAPIYLVSALDISQRKQAELELLAQMEFLTALADATPTLLVVVETADGSLTRDPVNSAYKELTGFSTEECAAVSFWGKVHPEDADSARAAFNTVVSTRRPASRISQWLKKDGSTFECEWTCTPLPPLGLGRMRPYLITGIDLTERRRQEREVAQSRARIVAAADQERRRVERNLHDGAQQRLVSLSLCLRLAQAKLASAPEDAHTILDGAAGELRLALTELRELARGLHPAVLSDLGLHSALRGLVQRTPVPVELDVAVEGRLPEQLEVALFYVVSEALTNIAKYAHATSASVSVVVEGPFVTAAISDDGIGGADARNGSGLTGLADRVAALNGTLTVASTPDYGTTVTARIPVDAETVWIG